MAQGLCKTIESLNIRVDLPGRVHEGEKRANLQSAENHFSARGSLLHHFEAGEQQPPFRDPRAPPEHWKRSEGRRCLHQSLEAPLRDGYVLKLDKDEERDEPAGQLQGRIHN